MRTSTVSSMMPCGGIQSAMMLMMAATMANQMAMISFELRCFMFFSFDAAKLRQYFLFTKKVNKKNNFIFKKTWALSKCQSVKDESPHAYILYINIIL